MANRYAEMFSSFESSPIAQQFLGVIPNADDSNIDANKGIVGRDYTPYQPLLDNMKMINDHIYEMTQFFDK